MVNKKIRKKEKKPSSDFKKSIAKQDVRKKSISKKVIKKPATNSIKPGNKERDVETSKKQEKKTLLLFCPRCKRETENTITGFIGQKIRRVRCEVCKSEYNYHRILALKKRMDEEGTAVRDKDNEHLIQQQYYRIWEDLMLGRDPNSARQYSIKDKYFENDLLNHPVFGIGIVKSVMEDYKIEVVFKNGIKVLAHNRFLSKK